MSKKIITQKIQIKVSKEAETEFIKNFGYRRWIYNKGLEKWNKRYQYCRDNNLFEKVKDPNISDQYRKELKKFLPSERTIRDMVSRYDKTSWRKDRPMIIFQSAISDLARAFKMFHSGYSGSPKFISKKNSPESCRYIRNNDYTIQLRGDNKRRLKLVKTPEVTLMEPVKYEGVIKQVTITREIDKWYASLTIETKSNPKEIPDKRSEICGVDLGVRTFATVYDDNGEIHTFNSQIDKLEKLYYKTKMYNRIMSRKIKGSRNYLDTRIKYQRTWKKIRNIRSNMVHQLTSFLVRNYNYITIEDLDVREMITNKNNLSKGIRKTIAESCFYEVKIQLEYKTQFFNSELVQVNRYFPSTQICSDCGKRTKIGRSKTYKCRSCEHTLDRDINASINIMREGKRIKDI